MRTYGIGPWDMHRLTPGEFERIAADLKAMNRPAKG
jgi:hypothetical protein